MMNTQNELAETVNVRRWPTESPLFVMVLLCAIALWILFAVSIIGIVYVALIGIFFFVSHVAYITYLRGSAVRLGPEQMPNLYDRVQLLSKRIGLKKTPAVYVMQAGGSLNALATKLFSSNFVVLYSDLIEACGDNTEARDMIIAHELGHLKAGHLRGLWFLLPGMLVPFLGSAYSRAREYTSDRYGFAICRDQKSALIGMGILSAGGYLGPKVNFQSLANQGKELNTVWMTLGSWLSTHPPIADRIVAIQPTLITNRETRLRGTIGAIALIIFVVAVPIVTAIAVGPKILTAIQETQKTSQETANIDQTTQRQLTPEEITIATQKAWSDMEAFSTVAEEYRAKTGELPLNSEAVYAAWKLLRPESEPPVDPFDGYSYGYETREDRYILWSEGPSSDTQADDLVFESKAIQQ